MRMSLNLFNVLSKSFISICLSIILFNNTFLLRKQFVNIQPFDDSRILDPPEPSMPGMRP